MCEEKKRVPPHVELLDTYYAKESEWRWLFPAMIAMRDEEYNRWMTQQGEFYCTFCKDWRTAAETHYHGSLLHFFTCEHCNADQWHDRCADEEWIPKGTASTCLLCGQWHPGIEPSLLARLFNTALAQAEWLVEHAVATAKKARRLVSQ